MNKLVKIMGGTAVIAALLTGCGSQSGPAAPAPKNNTQTNTTAPKKTTTKKPTTSQPKYDTITSPDGKSVQAINDGNMVDVAIEKTAAISSFSFLDSPVKPKQGEFYVVTIDVKNLTKGPIEIMSNEFVVYDKQGDEYMPDMDSTGSYVANHQLSIDPQLNPHEVTQTWVLFDVPKGTDIVKIVHHDEQNDKDLVWPVK